MDAPTLAPAALTEKLPDSAPPSPSPLAPAPGAALPTPAGAAPTGPVAVPVRTPVLIASMLAAAKDASDLIFSPGRAPQVDMHGGLVQLKIQGVGVLTPEDTARIAADLIGRNSIALQKLKEQGSCDISYSLPKVSRFRVNVFTQRGTCAIVMRVIPKLDSRLSNRSTCRSNLRKPRNCAMASCSSPAPPAAENRPRSPRS